MAKIQVAETFATFGSILKLSTRNFIIAKFARKLTNTIERYLKICVLPFNVDLLKTTYLFNVNPIMNVIGTSNNNAAVGAVMSFGK
jgi:hypothetical protein